ncbi:type 1 glutamine amidotransferase [Motiliproteus sp. SC1-56]|uniref:type 1 glutamine amidotransferase n=1 Tax=Motiliproteus sp. SC1-56 TaxID=2799565 RepID=UPI001A8BFDFE|nr:type 1 glutamine amidotransferase [Motiliproteus sp. SC1-56]
MNKHRSQLRILLMQIRDEPLTRQEELQSFAQFCELEARQFDILNLFDTPRFDHRVVEGYDALFVGGSSEASVLEPDAYPFVIHAQGLLRHCIAIKKPVFASCFGHQLAVMALGGEIVHDAQDFEMGTLPIQVTAAAQNDPLYRDTPAGFHAVAVHRERALEAPQGCTSLAYTAACNHAFKVEGAPFWTTQFHPEVDKRVLVERLTLYKAKYTNGDGHLQQVLDSAVDTPESNDLLRKFVDRVLLAGEGRD